MKTKICVSCQKHRPIEDIVKIKVGKWRCKSCLEDRNKVIRIASIRLANEKLRGVL